MAMPENPTRRDATRGTDGRLPYRNSSMTAAQIGTEEAIRHVNPESANWLAQSMSPWPPSHSRFPTRHREIHSAGVGFIRSPCIRAMPKRIRAAAGKRSAPNMKGGKPLEKPTPTRMAR